jgi:hypothetical protein
MRKLINYAHLFFYFTPFGGSTFLLRAYFSILYLCVLKIQEAEPYMRVTDG